MPKKNILFILTDQERQPIHMPKGFSLPGRDRLAAMSLTFNNYHTVTAPCTPSRSVIFTGHHTVINGMLDNTSMPFIEPMNPDIPTLGDMLQAAGYACAYRGKWHLADIKETQEPRHTTEGDMAPYGFPDYQHSGDMTLMAWEGWLHDRTITAEALHWLRGWLSGDREKPFFLVVGLVNPHDIMTYDTDEDRKTQTSPEGALAPIRGVPPDETYRKTWSAGLPPSFDEDASTKPAAHAEFMRINDANFGEIPLDRRDMWERLVDYYLNAQVDVDRNIQALVDALESFGLLEDTIIVRTADHGEQAGAHGLHQKGPWIYRETTNVPLMIAHPDGPKGTTTEALASSLDLAPTLMGLAGLTADEQRALFPGLPGNDLTCLIPGAAELVGAERRDAPRDAILFMYTALSTIDADFSTGGAGAPDLTKRGLLLGIFDGRYKFARYFSPAYQEVPVTIEQLRENCDLELYDLDRDENEAHNLAVRSDCDELIVRLNAKLNALVAREVGSELLPIEIPSDVSTLRGPLS
ncbi:MAG: sulfatase-like hydrolase/transferase [Alphaproteobacteria bacterium]|nr:sulfatase-like hydrolase/transferase [Alphaproteobacteria bacterium]